MSESSDPLSQAIHGIPHFRILIHELQVQLLEMRTLDVPVISVRLKIQCICIG